MQVTVTLADGTTSTFTADDTTATLTVSWSEQMQDGWAAVSQSQSFAAAEVSTVAFGTNPAPARPARSRKSKQT